jgi:hypothetical protein
MIAPYEDRNLYYEDKFVGIIFSIPREQIGFTISNNTNRPIKIDWNQCSYIDVNKLAHAVIHTGVRYLERDKPQVPTVIPPSAMINDVILLSDYVDYTSGSSGGWKSKAFFPVLSDDPKNNLYVGKSFGLFMPLEIDGQVRNYSFLFRIETDPL